MSAKFPRGGANPFSAIRLSGFLINSCGLRQGDNISPILFSLYLNDLETYLEVDSRGVPIVIDSADMRTYMKLLVMLYADDTILVSEDPESFEVLRWQNVEISDRKCHLCDKQDVGDEMHYLLICPYFSEERKKFVKRYYFARPNTLKFKQLLNTKNIQDLRNLCLFVEILMKTVI